MSNQHTLSAVKYSVLDLATIKAGLTPADSFHESLRQAQQAEKLGYTRYWFAEHHNMPNVASSATSLLIGYVADNTSTIRVGSGGIMLPNHAPLVVAEQFGTLASLYPGRIDLGLGRAPGSDQLTSRAIRGLNINAAHNFYQDIRQLQTLFSPENEKSALRAFPGEGLNIPIWVLGSSTDSAHLAAAMGLPYAFASHFAPQAFKQAIQIYREEFQPSAQLDKPYVLACVNVVAADSTPEAAKLLTSLQQLFLGIVTGKREPLQPPVDTMAGVWDDAQQYMTNEMLRYTFAGDKETISRRLEQFVAETGVNEIMATSHIFDEEAKLKSYRLFAEVFGDKE
ncbi:LLM class flavin-dependent oxidoreductase [Deminuibacter soli]|uniref:Luciferase-like monooxygenase n=1 Tax=Deminuibacter soli TaxID=2291815 RepID=A0A3E1NF45_9BACT|nr:LLM class flavin-dependent oxidoreductase [Deminuibacter soli]RFM26408.1 LLM class flavin-dependent oxidoreductase [Deminuibacter soli]